MGLSHVFYQTSVKTLGLRKDRGEAHTHKSRQSCLDSVSFHLLSALFHPCGRFCNATFHPLWRSKLWAENSSAASFCYRAIIKKKEISSWSTKCSGSTSRWSSFQLQQVLRYIGLDSSKGSLVMSGQPDRKTGLGGHSWHLAQHPTGGRVNLTVRSQGVTACC